MNKFSYCVLWEPIPWLTWLFPIIGYMGISTSNGEMHMFTDASMGRPARYLRLSPGYIRGGQASWDAAVARASRRYVLDERNGLYENSFWRAARALLEVQYAGIVNWNGITLGAWMLIFGEYNGNHGIMSQWFPLVIFVVAFIWSLKVLEPYMAGYK